MGIILPITKAATFIQDLKEGQVKWNGVLDLSIDEKKKRIIEAARQGNWRDAREKADEELRQSFDPQLLMTAGVMHFCTFDSDGAKKLFAQFCQ